MICSSFFASCLLLVGAAAPVVNGQQRSWARALFNTDQRKLLQHFIGQLQSIDESARCILRGHLLLGLPFGLLRGLRGITTGNRSSKQ